MTNEEFIKKVTENDKGLELLDEMIDASCKGPTTILVRVQQSVKCCGCGFTTDLVMMTRSEKGNIQKKCHKCGVILKEYKE